MKKILSILLALALMLGAAFALAEGNVTIAVQGMNDFNDYIQSMSSMATGCCCPAGTGSTRGTTPPAS